MYGKYHRLETTTKDLDTAADIALTQQVESCKLPKSVQDLIKLLIDEDLMKAVVVKFGLDLDKMPLGRIGQKEIRKGCYLLTNAKKYSDNNESSGLLEATWNEFYSVIPHKVNCKAAKLNTVEHVREKVKLLIELYSINFSNEILFRKNGQPVNRIFDQWLEDLKVQIEPLERSSNEFIIINQHIEYTRMNSDLRVVEIFKIQRKEYNYPHFNSPNRKLLWHGSRVINFNSILANGLLMNPSGSHVQGLGLGQGIYFTDFMANAAENYCCTHDTNNIGLIALCEVALGESLVCYHYENYELPSDKQSIFAVGKTSSKSYNSLDGAKIAWGETVTNENIDITLDYNEFLVKENDRVQIKYLVQFEVIPKNRASFSLNDLRS